MRAAARPPSRSGWTAAHSLLRLVRRRTAQNPAKRGNSPDAAGTGRFVSQAYPARQPESGRSRGMAIDWEKVAARIEELKRNPPTVWRGGPWPDEEEGVPSDYAPGFDDAFEGHPKRSDPSPAYEEGWAAHFERVADWKRFMEANGLSLEGYEFSSEWEREYCERNSIT